MTTPNTAGNLFDDNSGLVATPEGGFIPIGLMNAEEESKLKQLSQLELYWARFRKHRLALVGAGALVALVVMAILADVITPGVGPYTIPFFQLNVPLFGLAHPPAVDNFPWRLFGTTSNLNYSVLSQITHGARLSLFISFVGAILSSVIGTSIGAVSGYFGGWVDNLVMRITDIFLTIPLLPLLITVSAIYSGGGVLTIILILGLLTWPGTARLVRAQYLSIRETEYVEAAKATGVNDVRIMFRHILPNVLSPVIVVTTLSIASFVSLEATLDFLGLGVRYPDITWGLILNGAQGDLLVGDWWWAFFPGMFLVITVLAVNFIGDGLRDALDVRTRIE
jgi:peptide/nickel transport system permease protein